MSMKIGGKNELGLQTLSKSGWLAEQPEDFCNWIRTAGRWVEFDRNQLIYDIGDGASGLYGIATGSVDITFPVGDSEPVTVTREGCGFWIGDLALLARKNRLVSVRGATMTRAFVVPQAAVFELLAERPEHWHSFYQLSYENFTTALRLLAEVLSLPVKVRLARRLRALAADGSTAAVTQHDLARLLGITRSRLQRALTELTTQGLIETGYNIIRIRDGDALAAMCLASDDPHLASEDPYIAVSASKLR